MKLKLICQVLGSPEYCVAVNVDADAIVTELKEAIQQKINASCPAPLLQLYVLKRPGRIVDLWLGDDDPDLDSLAMANIPDSVRSRYVKAEHLMQPRRALHFYFNPGNYFGSAAVHVLVQVPRVRKVESSKASSREHCGAFNWTGRDDKMQSVNLGFLGHIKNWLQTLWRGLHFCFRFAKDTTRKIYVKLHRKFEDAVDQIVELLKSFFGVQRPAVRLKFVE